MKLAYTFNTLLLTLLLLTQACHSQNTKSDQEQGSLAALDEKNGFQDAKFGMPLSAFSGMIPDENNESGYSHQTYTRLSDKKMLGEIPLSLVEYTFYKDRLISIQFRAEGEENSYNVLQALRTAYGPGKETILGPVWEGKNVLMNSIKLIVEETKKNYIRIDISSQKMYQENREEAKRKRKEKAEKNANDL